MGNINRSHSPDFKAKIALDLIRGIEPMSTICSKHSIHPTQAGRWKQQLLDNINGIFSTRQNSESVKKDELIEELYRQIGQLKVELDWLKKKSKLF